MRFSLFSLVLLHCLLADARASDDRQVDGSMRQLGERFVAAIRDNNIVAYAHCWAPGDVCRGLQQQHSGPVSDLAQRQLAEYYLARDIFVSKFFRCLRQQLLARTGDLSEVVLLDLTGQIRVHHELRGTGDFILTLQVGEKTTVKINMDDGIQISDRWYFSDIPRSFMDVTSDGETRRIHLRLAAGQPVEGS